MSSLGIVRAVTLAIANGEGNSWRAWMIVAKGDAFKASAGLRLAENRDAYVMHTLARLRSEYPAIYSVLRAMQAKQELPEISLRLNA